MAFDSSTMTRSEHQLWMNIRNAFFAEKPEVILKEFISRAEKGDKFACRCLQQLLVETLEELY